MVRLSSWKQKNFLVKWFDATYWLQNQPHIVRFHEQYPRCYAPAIKQHNLYPRENQITRTRRMCMCGKHELSWQAQTRSHARGFRQESLSVDAGRSDIHLLYNHHSDPQCHGHSWLISTSLNIAGSGGNRLSVSAKSHRTSSVGPSSPTIPQSVAGKSRGVYGSVLTSSFSLLTVRDCSARGQGSVLMSSFITSIARVGGAAVFPRFERDVSQRLECLDLTCLSTWAFWLDL